MSKNFLVWWCVCVFLVLVCVVCIRRSVKDGFVMPEKADIPIYCINLPSEEARRDHILKVFGPHVEVVDAVDTRGDKWRAYSHYITDEGLEQMKRTIRTRRRDHHYELMPGAIGCFLSHIKCWNRFLDTYPSDGDFVFILEDDTMPSITFSKTFARIVEGGLPPDCDMLLCNCLLFGEMDFVEHNGVEYKHLRPRCSFYLTNAYFITARGIKRILSDLFKRDNKFYKQIDSHLSDLINDDILQVFALMENECFQLGISPTSIQIFRV